MKTHSWIHPCCPHCARVKQLKLMAASSWTVSIPHTYPKKPSKTKQKQKPLPSSSRSTSSTALVSFVKSSVSQTSKHSKPKRVLDQSLTTEFKQGVHQWTYHAHSLTHRRMYCQYREERWGLVRRERNDRLRWEERSRKGKRDGNPTKCTTF